MGPSKRRPNPRRNMLIKRLLVILGGFPSASNMTSRLLEEVPAETNWQLIDMIGPLLWHLTCLLSKVRLYSCVQRFGGQWSICGENAIMFGMLSVQIGQDGLYYRYTVMAKP